MNNRHLPMALTFSRIVCAPLIVFVMMTGWMWAGWIAAIIFILASLTDWADGYLARRMQVESNMGKLMDPVADKILVLGAILMLLDMNRVDPVMVFLLLARDIFIGGLRSVAAANRVLIAAKPFGKWKTALQMLSLPCMLIYDPVLRIPLGDLGYFGLWMSVALSMISGVEYTIGYYRNAAVQRF
jgi:CDP-diacylglycerol--glycerol-3-phosphate 3-phosphatidyltransferase